MGGSGTCHLLAEESFLRLVMAQSAQRTLLSTIKDSCSSSQLEAPLDQAQEFSMRSSIH